MPATSHQPPRLVLDTNVVVSGLLWRGAPRRLLQWAFAGETIALYSSPVLLDELAHTLSYDRLAPRITAFGTTVDLLVRQYTALVSLVVPPIVPRVVPADADDDHVIAAAVAARAHLIVTGDKKHLLPIGNHQGIEIVSAQDAVARLGSRANDK